MSAEEEVIGAIHGYATVRSTLRALKAGRRRETVTEVNHGLATGKLANGNGAGPDPRRRARRVLAWILPLVVRDRHDGADLRHRRIRHCARLPPNAHPPQHAAVETARVRHDVVRLSRAARLADRLGGDPPRASRAHGYRGRSARRERGLSLVAFSLAGDAEPERRARSRAAPLRAGLGRRSVLRVSRPLPQLAHAAARSGAVRVRRRIVGGVVNLRAARSFLSVHVTS